MDESCSDTMMNVHFTFSYVLPIYSHFSHHVHHNREKEILMLSEEVEWHNKNQNKVKSLKIIGSVRDK